MHKELLLMLAVAGFIPNQICLAQSNTNVHGLFQTFPASFISPPYTQAVERVLTYPASIATNLPDYQENFVLTSNGDYVANTDPALAWRHFVWKESLNGWRVGVYAPTNRPGYVVVSAGSLVTNSGPGYITPPFGKFATFELFSPDGEIMQPRPNAGTNMIEWCDRGFADHTNVPPWASPTNGLLAVDFPETALATDFPYDPIGFLADNYIFLAHNASVGMEQFELGDLYSITNEGDYTLTVQPVLFREKGAKEGYAVPAQTNVVLHRVDLPSITTRVHLVPKIK